MAGANVTPQNLSSCAATQIGFQCLGYRLQRGVTFQDDDKYVRHIAEVIELILWKPVPGLGGDGKCVHRAITEQKWDHQVIGIAFRLQLLLRLTARPLHFLRLPNPEFCS